MNDDKRMAELSEVQAKYVDELMAYPHVVGVGIGFKQRDGAFTDELSLVVMVDEKVPLAQLDAGDVLPDMLDGVDVDVQETGAFST